MLASMVRCGISLADTVKGGLGNAGAACHGRKGNHSGIGLEKPGRDPGNGGAFRHDGGGVFPMAEELSLSSKRERSFAPPPARRTPGRRLMIASGRQAVSLMMTLPSARQGQSLSDYAGGSCFSGRRAGNSGGRAAHHAIVSASPSCDKLALRRARSCDCQCTPMEITEWMTKSSEILPTASSS